MIEPLKIKGYMPFQVWEVLVYDNITELIGGTPLLNLRRYARKYEPDVTLLAKLEYLKEQKLDGSGTGTQLFHS